MGLLNSQTIDQTDFVTKSTRNAVPASDVDKVVKLETDARLASVFISPDFGDGSDGDVTISSPTTLTRDMYYNNLVVTNTLTTDGYRIFVKDTISGAGTIKYGTPNNGGNASGTTPGTGAAASGAGPYKNLAGGNGGAVDTVGAGGAVANPSIGVAGGNGGRNGVVGGGTIRSGGAGGTITAPVRKFGTSRWGVTELVDLALGTIALLKPSSGGGGGGGGSTSLGGASGAGGGGGASGGVIFIAARIWSGTFTVNSTGGNGGNGSAGVAPSADAAGGGGGGGGGGVSVILYCIKSWTGAYVLTAGTGGTITSGAGGAVAGSAGTAGVSYEFDIKNLL